MDDVELRTESFLIADIMIRRFSERNYSAEDLTNSWNDCKPLKIEYDGDIVHYTGKQDEHYIQFIREDDA